MTAENPLPPAILDYLHARGLRDETIETFGLSFDARNGGWIKIPVLDDNGDVIVHKCRAAPGNDAANKMMNVPSGAGAQLFGRGVFKSPELTRVVICEGEFDAMMLIQANIAAVSSTAGAMHFAEEWLANFPEGIEVILCFDNDEAGSKGREKVRDLLMLNRPDLRISDVIFAKENPKGYDVTDFFVEKMLASMDASGEGVASPTWCSEAGVDFLKRKRESAVKVSLETRKIMEVTMPSNKVTVEEWRKGIGLSFPQLVDCAEVCASVVAQLLIKDIANPFALVVSDRSGGGKTIVLNFFKELEGITYMTSDFSPASFVTNIAGRTKEQLEKIDLLPRIRWKTLMVKDMAPILSDNDDVLRKRLGMMIDILDGQGFRTESGVHGTRGYKGDYLFMMLTASTPWAPRIWKLLANLGQRFFFVELGTPMKTEDDLYAQISGIPYQVKESSCRELTHGFLRCLWGANQGGVVWDYEKSDQEAVFQICRYAAFLAPFRGDVFVIEERWTDGKVLGNTEVKVEDPSRANQCLFNLARGHAVVCGRNYITKDDLDVVRNVVLCSAPSPRPKIFKELLRRGGSLTVGEIAELLQMSDSTARREAHKFVRLGICDSDLEREGATNSFGFEVGEEGQKKKKIKLRQEFNWWFDVIKSEEKK